MPNFSQDYCTYCLKQIGNYTENRHIDLNFGKERILENYVCERCITLLKDAVMFEIDWLKHKSNKRRNWLGLDIHG